MKKILVKENNVENIQYTVGIVARIYTKSVAQKRFSRTAGIKNDDIAIVDNITVSR